MDALRLIDKAKTQLEKAILGMDMENMDAAGFVDGIYDLSTILARLNEVLRCLEKLEASVDGDDNGEIVDEDVGGNFVR